ncbi:PREDICTED: coiled-coil domain-containing protein 12 [Nicrophorus vespilloides]|uniref:Coiled-coil domain-containing protein 12 n=1 Tax=Nicrophorus vespilloides TaxID=110193 RepID=A0ABM1N6N4_NICVS|nr:PREDICTED: coiled-coil domain-containing protein 12 [Nicrophorus vespilloides]
MTSTLEEQALKRKERLLALKRKRNGEEETENGEKESNITLPKPVFRSYKPSDEELNGNVLPQAEPADFTEEIKEQLDAAKEKVVIDELDITNLAPRKPDWDLKRDVAKKLEKLERRTQKAIAELIRDRLKQRQEDLATMVNAATNL